MVDRVRPEDLGADVRPARSPLRSLVAWSSRPRGPAGTRRFGAILESAVRSAVELVGAACFVLAAWTVSATVGLVVLGVCLILAANFVGRVGRTE